jgi:hypothetical protein
MMVDNRTTIHYYTAPQPGFSTNYRASHDAAADSKRSTRGHACTTMNHSNQLETGLLKLLHKRLPKRVVTNCDDGCVGTGTEVSEIKRISQNHYAKNLLQVRRSIVHEAYDLEFATGHHCLSHRTAVTARTNDEKTPPDHVALFLFGFLDHQVSIRKRQESTIR